MRYSLPIATLLQAVLMSGTIAWRLTAQEYAPAASRCRLPAVMAACPAHRVSPGSTIPALPAGDAPAFLLAAVQLIEAPIAWREVYHEVEQCAGLVGDYNAVSWAVMEGPLQGPDGPTYAFTINRRIVLVRNDTTYLRHEMLHHILTVSGWGPQTLPPGERYSIANLHPMPVFGLCTGGL